MLTKQQKSRSYAGFIGANDGPPEAPANTAAPTITGTAEVGEVLTAGGDTWSGVDAPAVYYQWQRDGVDIDGTWPHATYTVADADTGATITVEATAENWAGKTAVVSVGVGPIGGE